MPRFRPRARRLLEGALIAVALATASCLPMGISPDGFCGDGCKAKAKVCTKASVMALARDLDDLEAHIERYGSVVVKQPDVWGQARMTKHRDEFEKEMEKELPRFRETLQGSLSRSDQAYFANAFALSAAVSGQQAGAFRPRSRVVVNNSTATAAGSTTETPTPLSPPALPTREEQADVFAAFGANGITRSVVPTPTSIGFTQFKTEGISLEPTIVLDQRARYLNHLNELRRINEGDDTADSPGYGLHLVRIPVSLLPGKRTDVGHGAEVTMTLTPHLSEELLPTTFRNLVINDLVDQVGVPLTQALNDATLQAAFAKPAPRFLIRHPELWGALARGDDERAEHLIAQYKAQGDWDPALDPPADQAAEKGKERAAGAARGATAYKALQYAAKSRGPDGVGQLRSAGPLRSELGSLKGLVVPATKLRRATLPFAPSQIVEIYSDDLAALVALETYEAFQRDKASRPCPCNEARMVVHLPDVQGYLQEELTAARRLLAAPCNHELWRFCSPELVQAIRTRKVHEIDNLRTTFLAALVAHSGNVKLQHSTTGALAWAVIVESALLNDRLVLDMKEVAAAKGCACAPEAPLPYFLPDPPAEARQAFNEYVRCRWPIHVFALDPVTQQQNIADTFSRRREMQLAMSLAFVSGQVSARNMMRYARRIEHDFETIDLNGTAVGFSHGDDTFGWRFYPRFQTPDIESNATVLFRDLFYGGPSRNADLRQRRLEPGMRECVAVVVMPSFVPYAALNVTSKWFKITNPKCKEPDLTDAMRLSRSVKAIQECSANVCDADCYRDGDLRRLQVKAKQLEARLPLQSAMVQVPYENTLGGFALFNSGVTDLAPQLTGYYGAPSINLAASTTVFLVGNHFSVHQTRVIAGGQEVPKENRELLSRQVMKVTIPAGALTVYKAKEQFVDVQVATPYGVTPHLLIPVCGEKDCGKPAAAAAEPPAPYAVSDQGAKVALKYLLEPQADGKTFVPLLAGTPAGSFRIDWNSPPGHTLKDVLARFTFKVEGNDVAVEVPLRAKNGYFEVADAGEGQKMMTAFATMLLKGVGNLRRYTPDKLIPSPLEGTVEVTPLPSPPPPAHAVKTVAVKGKVQVELQLDNTTRPVPPPSPPEMPKAPDSGVLPPPAPVPPPG